MVLTSDDGPVRNGLRTLRSPPMVLTSDDGPVRNGLRTLRSPPMVLTSDGAMMISGHPTMVRCVTGYAPYVRHQLVVKLYEATTSPIYSKTVNKECCQFGIQQCMSFMKKVCYAPIAVSASRCFSILRCHIRITLKIARYVVDQLFSTSRSMKMTSWYLCGVKSSESKIGPILN